MDLKVFYDVIVPLMEVVGTATICISTPQDEFNFYSELVDLKDDQGRHIFNVKHITGAVSVPWKSAEGRSLVQAIYGGNSLAFRREIMGEIASGNDNMAFNDAKLKKWFEKPMIDEPYEIGENTIFIALDPCGRTVGDGGTGSDTAIISFVYNGPRIIIVGMDNQATSAPEEPRYMLYAHIDALQRQPCFRHCKLMFIPEANFGEQAQILSSYLLRRSALGMCNAEILCQYPQHYGVFTFPGDPQNYVFRLQQKLAEDGFFFHKDFVCANPFSKLSKEALRTQTMQTFQRQMRGFRVTYKVSNSVQSYSRPIYSGKCDKDGKRTGRAKDDMCMALLFGYYYFTHHLSPNNLISSRSSRSMLQLRSGHGMEGRKH